MTTFGTRQTAGGKPAFGKKTAPSPAGRAVLRHPGFWAALSSVEPFEREHTLLIDDNHEEQAA